MAPGFLYAANGNFGYYEGPLDPATNSPHGHGTIDYTGGPFKDYRYEGNWEFGKKKGQGKLTGPAWEHEGTFANDLPEGHGVRNYKDGRIYDGWWKAGKKDGTGTQTWANTDWVYIGQWKDGDVSGTGTWHSETRGMTFHGDWTGDRITGTGVAKFSKGGTYKGKFLNGLLDDPNGTYTYSDGHTYQGGFSGGLRNGMGTIVKDKIEYRGNFVNDQKTGNFTVTDLISLRTNDDIGSIQISYRNRMGVNELSSREPLLMLPLIKSNIIL